MEHDILTLLSPHIWALSLTWASKPPPLNIAQSMKPQEMLFHDVLKDQNCQKAADTTSTITTNIL